MYACGYDAFALRADDEETALRGIAAYEDFLRSINMPTSLRELGVTSLRLVVASRGVVVPASWWGKIKTTTQIVAVVVILMEPAMGDFGATHIPAYIFLALMAITTVGSGINYLVSLWPYVSGKK